jgi:uncharacterized protein YnzC (UPF0291/DUF896 family)
MKKIAILFFVAFLGLSFAACDTNTMAFKEMSNICEDIEKNFSKYTEKDFEEITTRFSEIEKKMEARELTDSEKKELANLKGRYYGAFTKGAINSTKKEIKKITDELGSAVEGFIEGLK